MSLPEFAKSLHDAVIAAMRQFLAEFPAETPYAFAVIVGQGGNYLGCAIATEERLRRMCEEYERLGYRYRKRKGENADGVEKFTAWLRWANPDDGWHYADFLEEFQVERQLQALVEAEAFGEDAEELEEFCTQVFAAVQTDPDWQALAGSGDIVLGVTAGEDPDDFFRTATRCNPARVVRQLRREYRIRDEVDSRIDKH